MDVTNKIESQGVNAAFIWKIFRTHWVRILIIAVICAGAFGVYKYVATTPTYTSNVTFFVNAASKSGDSAVVNPGSTSAARQLAEAFGEVIASDRVVDSVYALLQGKSVDETDLADYAELEKAIRAGQYKNFSKVDVQRTINVKVNTQIIKVSITHADPQIAYAVAQAFEIVTPGSLDYVVGIKNTNNTEGVESIAKVVDRAEKDLTSSGTGAVTFALIGFVVGALLVYVIAFLRTFFDNTVYTEEQLKEGFENPVIGQIPSWNSTGKRKKKKEISHYISSGGVSSSARDYAGRLLGEATPFAVAESFKLLRTNMCYTTKGEACAVYGVTSATMGAGKSVVIANTAIAFGQMGKRVLLIDGDLRCPVQHRVFDMDVKAHGFSEVLAGVCTDAKSAIRTSKFENVDVLTSGRIPPNPAELLASPRMREFIAEVKKAYDVIFIDLPPICDVTDAGVISDVVTGYSFVVRSGYSDRRLIGVATDILENLGGSIIGFVLNDVDIKSGDYYKNRYSGYSKYSQYANYGATGSNGYNDLQLKKKQATANGDKATPDKK